MKRTVAAMAIIGLLVAGTEMTDNVHWADVFGPNGNLKSYSMGRKKDGKWWIEKDELCVDRGKDDGGCYQVWLSGKNVELRRAGLPAASEGVFQPTAARNRFGWIWTRARRRYCQPRLGRTS